MQATSDLLTRYEREIEGGLFVDLKVDGILF